jgi:histidinol-phosphate aminotransferase
MSLFTQHAQRLTPYVPSARFAGRRDADWLFLDWNETTFPLPDFVRDRICSALHNGLGVAYPDGDDPELQQATAANVGVKPENILMFNGSDSGMRDVVHSILEEGDSLAIVEPEYTQIATFLQTVGAIASPIKPSDPFAPDIEQICDAVLKSKAVYISNPSNPTGRLFSETDIRRILATGRVLLLDEAYAEFAGVNYCSLTKNHKNLFILRTFSKAYGLAGFRLGYVVTHEENIKILRKVRNSKEVNAFAQIAALSVLENVSLIHERIKEIVLERERLIQYINNSQWDIRAYPSKANFVMIRTASLRGLLSHLENHHILVRDRSSMHGLTNCARISIGTTIQMNRLHAALKGYYSTNSADSTTSSTLPHSHDQ